MWRSERDRNEALIRRLFDAFERKDGFGLRDVFAEDAVWHVPGDSVMAGTHSGRDAILPIAPSHDG